MASKATNQLENEDKLYVLAPGFDDKEDFDTYVLVAQGNDAISRPVLVDGHIVAVSDWRLIKEVLKLAPESYRSMGPLPKKATGPIDAAKMLSAVQQGGRDEHANTLDLVNIYLDLLVATGTKLPLRIKRVLWTLADHLTFEPDIGAAYKSGLLRRAATVQAVTWLYGAVTINMRVYDKQLLKKTILAAEKQANRTAAGIDRSRKITSTSSS